MHRLPRFLAESRLLFRLTGPLILSQAVYMLMGLMDTVMAGHAGAEEQAVVGLGVALWVPIFLALLGISQALSPVVAHHHGAGDNAAIIADTREGLWLAGIAGVVPFLLLPLIPTVLAAAQIEAGLAQKVSLFLWGIVIGLPAALLTRTLGFYSASINHTRPLMVFGLIGLAVNFVLNWVLIYGHWGAPALGGAGCGWATGIGMWAGLLMMVLYTARARIYRDVFLWHGWSWPHWPRQKNLLKIGLPMGASMLAEVSAFAGVALLIGRFGAVPIAAHQVALNFASLVFMLPLGLSNALSIRVGQALGAGDPRAARFIAWSGVLIGLAVAAAMVPVVLLAREGIVSLYTPDAAVQATASTLLLFAAVWQFSDATQVCAVGALRGYKVTVMPMWLAIGAFWLVAIPLGAVLGYHGARNGQPLGVYGFWTGLVVGLTLVAGGLVLLLRRVARDRITGQHAASNA
ncbi:proton-coupled multidrug efflux MATE transporter PmpM [Niveibacterium umoris]|uniref:Multidrug-efflux transporter n=1 Tax=Niveibacterium umoris TaxID=1193620 RepID=A0A840BKW5_9RHOO|nr:MATE family efflux transporter [Niveibacterium umoris]MBB4012189.1 MATE family multidrug resistance protein [Niveibacterium umoris]